MLGQEFVLLGHNYVFVLAFTFVFKVKKYERDSSVDANQPDHHKAQNESVTLLGKPKKMFGLSLTREPYQ